MKRFVDLSSSRYLLCVSTLILSTMLSGCSVYFAATGSKEPDLSKLTPGASRPLVEQELGQPLEEREKPHGTSALYSYKIGDQPNAGRAILFLVGDILTLALAEYIFFPLEISNSGNAHQVIVDYGKSGTLKQIRAVESPGAQSVLD